MSEVFALILVTGVLVDLCEVFTVIYYRCIVDMCKVFALILITGVLLPFLSQVFS